MDTISFDDVKIFYDQNNQPREVLINYDIFEKITQLLKLNPIPTDQGYFWTESWQSRIREAEEDIEAGAVKEVTTETLDSALEWLDE